MKWKRGWTVYIKFVVCFGVCFSLIKIFRIWDCAGIAGAEFLKLTSIEIKTLMCETDKVKIWEFTEVRLLIVTEVDPFQGSIF